MGHIICYEQFVSYCKGYYEQWMVLKDMFDCLDKLDATGNITGHDKKKVVGFLEDMGWQDYLKELTIVSNSTKINVTQQEFSNIQ